MKGHIFVLISEFVLLISTIYESVPGLYLGKQYYPLIYSPSTSFTAIWDRPIQKIINSGVSLTTFNLDPQYVLSFNITFISFSSTQGILNLIKQGSIGTFKNLKFRIILITQENPFLQMQVVELQFYPLNDLNKIKYYNISSDKFVFQDAYNYYTSSLVQSIKSYSSTNHFHYKICTYQIHINTNLIQFQVTSNNTLNKLQSVTLIIIMISWKKAQYAIFYNSCYYPGTFIKNFGVNLTSFGFPTRNRCITRLVQVQFYKRPWDWSVDTQMNFLFSGKSYINFNNIGGQNIAKLQARLLCIARCPLHFFVSPNQTYLCLRCFDFIQHCRTCINATNCTSCFKGRLVQGGCTSDIGCIQVNQNLSNNHAISTCIKCRTPQFILNLITHKCDCGRGWVAGLHCTQIIGCAITTIETGNKCLYCKTFQNFILNQSTLLCDCVIGFSLVGRQCKEICGDGMVFKHECDDGNLQNGDGCSSSCKTQKFYKCLNNYIPSICTYYYPLLQVKIKKIVREGNNNIGIFTFQFSPNLYNLTKRFNISNYFSFACSNSIYSTPIWNQSKSQISASILFKKDLESQNATFNFSFDPLYIHHQPLSINIKIISNTTQLIIYQNTESFNIYNYIFFAVSCVSLFLLIFTSWINKFGNIQLLFALQIIYYSHFTFQNYTLPVSSLQKLSLVGLNNLFMQYQYQNYISQNKFQKVLYYQNWFIYEILGSFTLLVFLTLFMITILIFISLYKNIDYNSIIIKYFNGIYHSIIYPISILLLLPSCLLYITYSRNHAFQFIYKQQLFLCLIIQIIIVSIYSSVILLIHQNKQQILKQKCYTVFLHVYIFITAIIITVCLNINFKYNIFILLFSIFLFMIITIILQPYNNNFDNFSIIFIQITLLVYLILGILRNYKIYPINQSLDVNYCIILSVLLIINLILTIARIFNKSQSMKIQEQIHQINNKKQQKIQQNQKKILTNNSINILKNYHKNEKIKKKYKKVKQKSILHDFL